MSHFPSRQLRTKHIKPEPPTRRVACLASGSSFINVSGFIFCALFAGSLLSTVGCENKASERVDARQARQRQLGKSGALLKAVNAQLQSLPETMALELRPPTVLLDARSSRNKQDVMAVAGLAEGAQLPIYNRIAVPVGNAGFKALEVRPGDIVKYYILDDPEAVERAKQTGEMGFSNKVALNLEVAQVLDDNSLLFVGGLTQPVLQPHRLEIWRVSDERMSEINTSLARYAVRGEPMLGWQPTPDTGSLTQIVERLNQWIRSRSIPDDWQPPELLETLPEELRGSETMSAEITLSALRAAKFQSHEGRLLQEALWTRDIGRWASGKQFEPLERARSLFDWTVRNITLSTDPRLLSNRPWQTLAFGRGTLEQRAWVFAALCRQQRLPAVVLTLPKSENAPEWLWCAVLHEGKLHLFDPKLGLELASDGKLLTLAEVQQDDSLLRQFDLPDMPYSATAAQARTAVANVVAEPLSLSWRAEELQRQLSGAGALPLQVEVDLIAKEITQLPSVETVQLWPVPFDLLKRQLTLGENTRNAIALEFRPFTWRPKLWKARAMHLRGKLETEEDAAKKNDALYDAANDHRQAGQLYMDPGVRPKDKLLKNVVSEKRKIYERTKADATYWLGLLQYEMGSYESAQQWLKNKALETAAAKHLTHGVTYNLARAHEAAGNKQQAAKLLATSTSQQKHGDLLRAKNLRQQEEARDN